MAQGSGLNSRPARVALGIASATTVLLLVRLRQGVQVYGLNGAAWLEHEARVQTLLELRKGLDGGFIDLVRRLDGPYPPGLHLISGALGVFTGHDTMGVAAQGILWLWALSALLATCARQLGLGPRGTAAVAAATFLVPAWSGMATRYYYDLPMTVVLWAGVALALRSLVREGFWGPLGVGLIGGLGLVLKPSFLALAPLVLGPAWLLGRAPVAVRVRGAALAGTAALASGAAWLALAGPESSVATQLDLMWTGLTAQLRGGISETAQWTAGQDLSRGATVRAAFHGRQLVTAALSPALALPFLVLGLAGIRRTTAALLLTLGLQAAFFIGTVPVLDERFASTLLPALVLLAGAGFDRLALQPQRAIAVAVVVTGLWVAADFHLGFPPVPGPDMSRADGPTGPVSVHGLGAADSVQGRGWSRRETTPPEQAGYREAIWQAVARCGATKVLLPDAPPDRAPAGDWHWLQYRAGLARLEDGGPQRGVVESCDEAGFANAALLASASGGPPDQPECVPSGWDRAAVLPSPDGSYEIGLWRPVDAPPCAAP